MPPISPWKREGKPLYEYARAGIDVARETGDVQIHELNLALQTTAEGQPALCVGCHDSERGHGCGSTERNRSKAPRTRVASVVAQNGGSEARR